VGEIQIPLVTCPKCLARVINPNAQREPLARTTGSRAPAPRQVISLEEEASGDVRDTTRWLVVLAVALLVGAVVPFIWLGMNLLSGLMIAGAVLMGVAIAALYRKSPQIHEAPAAYFNRPGRDGTTVLDYTNIHQKPNTGAFQGGFILAVGISFLTMMATSAGRDVN
jgi:hypothetical protein